MSVTPPLKSETTPDELAGNVCDSFVKNAVTASVPSVPSAPPWILNIVVVSVIPSLVTESVKGKSVLFNDNPLNDKLPLCCPEPLSILDVPPKDGVDIVEPPALVIVMSLVAIVADYT